MSRNASTSLEIEKRVRTFVDKGEQLPPGRGGRWSATGLVRLLGFTPAENYVQYIWKSKEILDVLNHYAAEQGYTSIGTNAGERVNDEQQRKQHLRLESQARDSAQAALMARTELRVLSQKLHDLERENATLRAENDSLRAQIASIRQGFVHRT